MKRKQKKQTRRDQQSLVQKIRSNYMSFIIGFVSLVVLGLILFQLSSSSKKTQTTTSKDVPGMKQEQTLTPPVSKETTHTVVEGETLWSIAEKHYQSGEAAFNIAQVNNIVDPNIIVTGTKLKLPQMKQVEVKGEITATAAQTSVEEPNKAPEPKTYIVQEGDYLFLIAEKVYGDGNLWTKIAEANNLTEPNFIHKGNILILP
jgi:nucleoid-associated protein YgaU